MCSRPSLISSKTVASGFRLSRDWSTYANATVDPISMSPESGFSSSVIILNNVVLPAPFGPMTPTMPPGGNKNERFSMSNFSSKLFTRSVALTTVSPRRGPGGIMISNLSARRSEDSDSATSSLNDVRRALPLLCRARGDMRIHSSSLSSAAWRTLSDFSS